MDVSQRIATVFMMVGFCIAQVVIPADFPSKSESGINVGRALCIGAVGGVFGPIGYGLGLLFARRRPEEA